MSNASIREQLYRYIEVAYDAKIEAMYQITGKDMGNQKYTPAELAEFYSRLE